MEDYQLDIVVEGSGGVLDPPDAAPFHTRRGDDPHRDDHRSAAGPLRPGDPARLLRRRGPGGDRAPGRRDPRRRHRPRRRVGDRPPQPGDAAHRQSSPPACATSPRSEQGRIDVGIARDGLALFGVDELGLEDRPCRARRRPAASSAGDRSACPRWRSVGEQAVFGRGRVRAVPHPAWPHRPHPAGRWRYRPHGTTWLSPPQPLRPHRVRSTEPADLAQAGRLAERKAAVFAHDDRAPPRRRTAAPRRFRTRGRHARR